jgi:1,2-phenylacetyl-CoA epoxidase PaaB subunit
MRTPVLLLIVLFALPVVAEDDDFHVHRDSLRAAFGDGTAEDRLAAVQAVATYKTEESTELLVSVIPFLQNRVEALIELRELMRTGRDKSLKGRDPTPHLALVKKEIDGELQCLFAIEEGFAKLTDEGPMWYLAKSVMARHKHWKARELGVLADRKLVKPLTKALKDKDVRVRVAVILSLGALRAETAYDALLKLLADKDWTVRSAVIDALVKIRNPLVIPAFIERLKKEEGRIAEDVAEALEKITGQKFGRSVEAWEKWWADNKARIEAGEDPMEAPKEPEELEPPKDDGYYHGIPIKSHRTVFILDISESMTYSASDFRLPKEGEKTRLGVAKDELTRALHKYPSSGTFGLIAFHTIVKAWRPRMVKATASMRDDAKDWVADLEPTGTTNIYAALEASFRMAGMGLTDKYYVPTVDTVFLLSDGAPTNEDASEDDPDRVLRAVRQWNRLGRMKIHTIGLLGHSESFMSSLAKQNGGTYRSVD